jgi:hypothetical protein
MKRASYREAVSIAAELDTDVTDVPSVSGLVTVHLIACIFDVTAEKVAIDIVKHREKQGDAS